MDWPLRFEALVPP
ncbi:hypothetical protein VCHC52A1_2307, partial [Vibrio cholerae HC-52A1]